MTGDKSHLGTKTCYQGSLVKQTVAPKNQCIFANNKHVSISYKTYWWYSQFIRAKMYTNKVVIVQRQKWNKSQLCIVCINNLKSRSFPYKYKHPTLQPNQKIRITVTGWAIKNVTIISFLITDAHIFKWAWNFTWLK